MIDTFAAQRNRFVHLFIAACLVALIGACAAGAYVARGGALPLFYKPVWLPNRHAIVFSNGAACPPNLDNNPCYNAPIRPVFRIIYMSSDGSHLLVQVAQQ